MPAALNAQNLRLNILPTSGGAGNTISPNDAAAESQRAKDGPSSLPKRPSLPSTTEVSAPESIKSSPKTGTPTDEANKNVDDAEPRTAGVSEADTPRNRDEETLRDKLMRSMGPRYTSVEEFRLDQAEHYEKHWRRWGPYLSERQWVSYATSCALLQALILCIRVPSERITRQTAMLGTRSTLINREVGHTDGEKTVSVVFRKYVDRPEDKY